MLYNTSGDQWLGNAIHMLYVLGLVAARLLPTVVFTPVFGGQLVPARLRVLLTFVLSVALCPPGVEYARAPHMNFIMMIGAELICGLSLAVMVMICFEGATAAGALIDLGRGASMSSLLDPASQQSTLPMGVFMRLVAIASFYSVGLPRYLLTAIAESFRAIPMGTGLGSTIHDGPMAALVIRQVSVLLMTALKLAMPALAIVFLFDVILAFVNRLAGSIDVYFLGLSAKGPIALFVTLGAFGLIVESFGKSFATGINEWSLIITP